MYIACLNCMLKSKKILLVKICTYIFKNPLVWRKQVVMLSLSGNLNKDIKT